MSVLYAMCVPHPPLIIPELVQVADIMHIYDNTSVPYRIFKKRKTEYFIWENDNWSEETIKKLVGLQ